MAVVSEVLALAGLGFRVVPLHKIHKGHCSCQDEGCRSPGKHPVTAHGVYDATSESEKIRELWSRYKDANVAIVTGTASGVDVLDVDGEAGQQALARLEAKFGKIPWTVRAKTGKGCHLFFKHDDRVRNKVALDTGLDIRSTNGYVVAPPSQHISGKRYEWEISPEETEVAEWPSWLIDTILATKKRPDRPAQPTPQLHPTGRKQAPLTPVLINSSLEAMKNAAEGGRNNTLNESAYNLGQLVGAGQDIGDALDQLRAIALQVGLGEIEVAKTLSSGFERGKENPRYLKIDPDREPPRPAHKGLENPPTSGRRTRIEVVPHELERMADEGEQALIDSKLPVFARYDHLVRMTEAERYSVDLLPDPQLLKQLSIAADWYKSEFKKGKGGETRVEVSVKPPADVVSILQTQGKYRLRQLRAVYDAPILRPDGTVLQDRGYDAKTMSIHEPKCVYPRVADNPTREDALKALSVLCEPVVDFPFTEPSDRSTWVAMILTILGRPAIAGPTPLFLIRATDRGSGKSLLADVASAIVCGTDASRMAFADNPEEEDKRIGALVKSSSLFTLIDNIDKPLGGPILAAVLTATTYTTRELGRSGMITGPVPVLCGTGVNVVVKDDLGRRVLPIDLDPGVENPEKREGFKYPDVLEWSKEHRTELAAAALTILRAYFVAGRPQLQGMPVFGSYEAWSKLIRQLLVWLGQADPCMGREKLMASGDSDRDDVLNFLTVWQERFPGGMTLVDALEQARRTDQELLETLHTLVPKVRLNDLDTKSLGLRLRTLVGRVVGGMKLAQVHKTKRGIVWTVMPVTVNLSSPHRHHLSSPQNQPAHNEITDEGDGGDDRS